MDGTDRLEPSVLCGYGRGVELTTGWQRTVRYAARR
jgi:hypothetical protein